MENIITVILSLIITLIGRFWPSKKEKVDTVTALLASSEKHVEFTRSYCERIMTLNEALQKQVIKLTGDKQELINIVEQQQEIIKQFENESKI